MRVWISICAIFLLIFTVPALVLSLFKPPYDATHLLIYCVLIALAVRDLIYVRRTRSDPARAYRHLAVGQFLLGVVVGALMLRIAYLFNQPQIWEDIRNFVYSPQLWEQLQDALSQMAATNPELQQVAIAPPTDAEWQHIAHLLRSVATITPLAFAVFSVLSQGLFAWLLYRRARKADAAVPAVTDIRSADPAAGAGRAE